MGIGVTKQQLIEAGQGKMPPKSYAVEQTPPEAGYQSALARRSALSSTAQGVTEAAGLLQGQANVTGGVMGSRTAMSDLGRLPAAGQAPTSTYETLVKGLARSRGGLDPDKGKYGGFYSASDLESAIAGSAIGFRERTTQDLRREALERYGAIDPMYEKARLGARGVELGKIGFKPQAPASAAGFRQFEEVTGKPPEALKAYGRQLSSWYEKQAKPAEEYLATAQQIETTPLSKLAESIAVNQFGMNPDLAASKFRGLDQSYWQDRRNQQYMEAYGVPYDEYMAQIQEGERQQRQAQQATKYMEDQAESEVENISGFKASVLGNITGQTPSQVYATLVNPTTGAERAVVYKNPATGQEVQQNAAGLVQTVRELINNDDREAIAQLMESLGQYENQQDMLRLIRAMVYAGGAKDITVEQDITDFLGQ